MSDDAAIPDAPKGLFSEPVRALVICDDWFTAPDGGDYKMTWGTTRCHEAKRLFGFDPKAGANFFLLVGEGDGAMLIAGCRVHYAFASDAPPPAQLSRCYVPPSDRPGSTP